MDLIPKIKLNDPVTWVEAQTIAISATDLVGYAKRLNKYPYLADRKIIVLSIIPDEFENNYLSILEKQYPRIVKPETRIILTSADCACYQDHPDWCDEEITWMVAENLDLFKHYKIQIGILKGYNAETYQKTRKHLEPHVPFYLLYLTGEIRSDPLHFSLRKFFQTNFPQGLDKPVYLHGCPLKQMQEIPQLNITVQGIITAGHLTDAFYRGHRHYRRETRIQKAWAKWVNAITTL